MSEYLDKYDRSTNLIQQRVDREDYRHGWKDRKDINDLKRYRIFHHKNRIRKEEIK